jgi:hypothetical protein
MKKLMFAALSLACMFAISSTGPGPRPAAAAPAAPAESTAPQFGACRWFCGGPPAFKTEAECASTCKTECEAVC